MTTSWSSLVTPTSSSSMSAPARTAFRKAYSVFEGNSSSPPWCAMFSTRRCSQGFAVPPAGAGVASRPIKAATASRIIRWRIPAAS
jgi:hypothetical protein